MLLTILRRLEDMIYMCYWSWRDVTIPGARPNIKKVQLIKSIFQASALIMDLQQEGPCSNQVIFFILLNRATVFHYDTNIIKFGWELSISWVISDGLSFSEYAQFLDYQQRNYKLLEHYENDNLEKNTHKIKSSQPNLMILVLL